MKKLCVVLAAVVFTTVAQAVSVSWAVSNIYKGNTTDKALTTDGYMVYLISDAAYAQSTAASALAGGSLTASDIAGKAAVSHALTSDGRLSTTADLGDLADGTYYYYNVIVGDGNAVVGDKVKLEVTQVGNPQLGSFNAKTLTQSSANWKPAGGSSGDIPEPTSGLLLLVGAGMLALRRKQK